MSVSDQPRVLLKLLANVAGELAARPDARTVAGAVLPAVTEVLGAQVGTLALLDGPRTLRVLATVGMSAEVTEPWVEFDISAAVPLAACVRDDRPLWLRDVETDRDTFQALPAQIRSRSLCTLPLHHGGLPIGVIGLGWAEGRTFDETEQQMLVTVAELAASACAQRPLPRPGRLDKHRHDAPDGVHIACLARPDGSRCAVHQHRAGSRPGSASVFATLLDADPRLGSSTLDAVSGVLALSRRRRTPPALVGQSIAEMSEDLDGAITGAHVEISPESRWVAVAPLDHVVVIATSSVGDGIPTAPTETQLAGERIVLAQQAAAVVIAIALDAHTEDAHARLVATVAGEIAAAPAADAYVVLDALHRQLAVREVDECVRGALAVVLEPVPAATERSRQLPARPVSTVLGRRFAVAALPDDAHPDVEHAAELVVNELVANAVRHADENIEVTVTDEPTGTKLAVSDDDDRAPELRSIDEDAEHGRGMTIVEALSDEVGITRHADGGKSIWARLRWRP